MSRKILSMKKSNSELKLRKVFISHNNTKADFAKKLSDRLEALGFITWLAPRDIPEGDMWDDRIPDGIKACDVVVLLLCAKSNESPHVRTELELAMKYRKHVICVRVENIEPVNMEYFLSTRQWINWFAIYEDRPIEKLVNILNNPKCLERPKNWVNPVSPIVLLVYAFALITYFMWHSGGGILSPEARYDTAMMCISNMDSTQYREYIKHDINAYNLYEFTRYYEGLVNLYREYYALKDNYTNHTALIHNIQTLSDLYISTSNYDKAIACYEEILSIIDEKYYSNTEAADYDRLTCYEKLAEIRKYQGNLSSAMDLSIKALELRQKLNKDKDSIRSKEDFCRDYQRLSESALALGRLSEARNFAEKASELARNILLSKNTVTSRRNVGVTYFTIAKAAQAQGKLDEAADFFIRSLEIIQKITDETKTLDSQELLSIIYNDYGEILWEQGKLGSAEKIFERASKLREDILTKSDGIDDHRLLMRSYGQQGRLALAQGKFTEAKTFFEKSAKINRELSGATHNVTDTTNLSVCYNFLGQISRETGNLHEAEEFHKKSVRNCESLARRTNNVHARRILMGSYNALGNLKQDTGNLQEAENLYIKCLELAKALAEETNLLEDRLNLSLCYLMLGGLMPRQARYSESLEYYNKSLELTQTLASETHSVESYRHLAENYKALGILFNAQDRYSQAYDYYNKQLEILKSLIVRTGSLADRENAAECYENIGKTLRSQDKLNDAEEFFAKAHDERNKIAVSSGTHGTHRDSFSGLYNLGYTALRQNNAARAENFLIDALGANREHSQGLGSMQNRLRNIDAVMALAETSISRKETSQAELYYDQAVEECRKLVKASDTLDARKKLADTIYELINFLDKHGGKGHKEKISGLYYELIESERKRADSLNNPDIASNLTAYYYRAGLNLFYQDKINESEELFRAGIEYSKGSKFQLQVKHNISSCYLGMSLIHEKRGDFDKAVNCLEQALAIMKEEVMRDYTVKNRNSLALTSSMLGEMLYKSKNYERAKTIFLDTLKILEPLEAEAGDSDNRRWLSGVYKYLGNIARIHDKDNKLAGEYFTKSENVK